MPRDASAVGALIEQIRALAQKYSTGTIGVMPAEPSARSI